MKSRASSSFWKCHDRLPPHIQQLAEKNYRLWLADPRHPSLAFKKLKGSENRYSVRVGEHHRALACVTGDEVLWVWIGTHEEYNKLVGR